MDPLPPPLAFLLLLFSGWVNRHQQAVIDYLLEENRVLRAVNGSRRLRLTDDQRRRLAVKGQVLGRRPLAAVAGIGGNGEGPLFRSVGRKTGRGEAMWQEDVYRMIQRRATTAGIATNSLLRPIHWPTRCG